MHFCTDELLMLMATIPFLGYAVTRVRGFFGKKTPTTCCEHPHTHEKSETVSKPAP